MSYDTPQALRKVWGRFATTGVVGIRDEIRVMAGRSSRCIELAPVGAAQGAIERLRHTRVRAQLARSHLLYGEWLRREPRQLQAREQLRTAHAMFTEMGVEAFIGRAERELSASGQRRKRNVQNRDELTAQEAQIARLARDGLSNPEIGTRLFISPRTAEYHLRKVFDKLDIRSRRELENVLREERASGWPVSQIHADLGFETTERPGTGFTRPFRDDRFVSAASPSPQNDRIEITHLASTRSLIEHVRTRGKRPGAIKPAKSTAGREALNLASLQ